MLKNFEFKFLLFSMFVVLASCGGGGGSGSATSPSLLPSPGPVPSPSPSIPDTGADSVVTGIGSGGGAYTAGMLDGNWTTDCEGGANGDNWSYRRNMTISGISVQINETWYRANQACTGGGDVESKYSFSMNWGTYDTTGYSADATYSNHSWKVKPLTAAGATKLNYLNYGVCTAGVFVVNTQLECSSSATGSYKYFMADNIFLPEVQGPENYAQTRGIAYAFGTYRKVLSNGGTFDGIYAAVQSTYKLIISGNKIALIESDLNSSFIRLSAGTFIPNGLVSSPPAARWLRITFKSIIAQGRSAAGVTFLNSNSICGLSNYTNGTVKNLITTGTCSATHYEA
ncbi:MAG: hypothetical protein K2P92_03460, partial [Bdellovibrionaceae bacterium]|nr:hypothetical protein [Pseudobdellovibrionaceae bacterium]